MGLRPRDIQKAIKRNAGSPEALRVAVFELIDGGSAVDLLPHMSGLLRPYFSSDEVLEIIKPDIDSNPELVLNNVAELRHFFPDEDLRARLLLIHAKSPWTFYIKAEGMKDLFSVDFFKEQIKDNDFDFEDNLFRLFQLFYSSASLGAFGETIRRSLEERLEGAPEINVRVGEMREPGFACGGMERNYLEASKSGAGLCLVNGCFLAKYFHRKGDAKKVSIIADQNYRTINGGVIWEGYLYAPTNGQHAQMMEAIEQGEKEIHISNLVLRPSRPMVGITSQDVFQAFEESKLA